MDAVSIDLLYCQFLEISASSEALFLLFCIRIFRCHQIVVDTFTDPREALSNYKPGYSRHKDARNGWVSAIR